jgi:hypothetical protein
MRKTTRCATWLRATQKKPRKKTAALAPLEASTASLAGRLPQVAALKNRLPGKPHDISSEEDKIRTPVLAGGA